MVAQEPEHEDASVVNNNRGGIASRLVKKVRISGDDPSSSRALAASLAAGTRLEHPLGVKPIGNFFEEVTQGVAECRASGLGRLACLADSQLLALLNFCSSTDLAQLASCSRASYIYSMHDELWRVLVLEEMEGQFKPQVTWKRTYVATRYSTDAARPISTASKPVRVRGVYSDLLFQSFYCAAAPIEDAWLAVENIDRRSAKDMTLADFKRNYEGPNVPVIITEAIDEWPAMQNWTDDYLAKTCEGQTFYAGGFQLTMDKYMEYSRTLVDDQPLFIFDKEFVAKVPQLGRDYAVPEYFQEDLFALLGTDKRPDYRWLIIGPKKSGSSFHIDPNATNAWNGVVRGAKKWVMFPPEVVPPGVHPSDDGSEVSTPVSLMEWFVTFYPQVRKLPAHLKPLEGICREGETMFVPHGWWHCVLNLEESVAITQNFVSSGNVKNVLQFLTEKPEQVSGCAMEQRPRLGAMFSKALADKQPELYAKADKEVRNEYERKHRKSKWELLLARGTEGKEASPSSASNSAAPVASNASSFGFGFSFE